MASRDDEFKPGDVPVFEAIGICHTCVHKTGVYTCKAFPNGIPLEILTGDRLHTRPYPGDKGIQYQRMIRGVS